MSRGTLVVAAGAAADTAARPRMAARKRIPRAVVRWRLMRGGQRSGARSKGRRLAGAAVAVTSLEFAPLTPETCLNFGHGSRCRGIRVRRDEDRRLREAGARGRAPPPRPELETARPLRRRRAQPVRRERGGGGLAAQGGDGRRRGGAGLARPGEGAG